MSSLQIQSLGFIGRRSRVARECKSATSVELSNPIQSLGAGPRESGSGADGLKGDERTDGA